MKNKIGLVLGSFAPLHNGHLSLINYGLLNCDLLYIFLCSHDKEDIPGDIRYKWLQEEFKGIDNIKIIHKDTSHMENTSVSDVNISKVWSVYLKELFPDVNVIFTSEKYGDYVAVFMNIEHMQYDEPRINTPISSTLIKAKPLTYWEYLPKSVRPYYTKKVCICGTESTGKTVMTNLLSDFYGVRQAKEMAREINDTTFECTKETIKEIIIEQAKEIHKNLGDILLFSDTDLITATTYNQFLFNEYPDYITDDIKNTNKFDMYLYLWNDVPYIEDGGRMGEDNRNNFHELLYENFKYQNAFVIKGSNYEDRFNKCIDIIDWFIAIN